MSKTHITAMLLSSAVVLTASAQQPPNPSEAAPIQRGAIGKLEVGVDPNPASTSALIQKPTVQDELKLTDAQRKRIEGVAKELRQRMDRMATEGQAQIRELGPQPDPRAVAEAQRSLVESTAVLRAEAEAATLKALEPRQRTRLIQIRLQAEGPLAFSRPEVLERLNLAPDQIATIQEIVGDGRGRMTGDPAGSLASNEGNPLVTPEQSRAFEGSNQPKAEAKEGRESTTGTRKATMQAIAKVLTKGQRSAYRKLVGEPFDLAKLQDAGTAPAAATATKQDTKVDGAPSAKPKPASKPTRQNAK
jgi:Spy/CpxP family protein refolding chaperone